MAQEEPDRPQTHEDCYRRLHTAVVDMQRITMLVRSMRHHQQRTSTRGRIDDDNVTVMQRMMMQMQKR